MIEFVHAAPRAAAAASSATTIWKRASAITVERSNGGDGRRARNALIFMLAIVRTHRSTHHPLSDDGEGERG